MQSIISISGLSKTYASGFAALKRVDLDIRRGEIFALLGPNGAGKSTLIGVISSLVNASSGSVTVFGIDLIAKRSEAMRLIGLVPQEINFNMFEKPLDICVNYAGFYGIPRAEAMVRAEEELKRAQTRWLNRWEQQFSDPEQVGCPRAIAIGGAQAFAPSGGAAASAATEIPFDKDRIMPPALDAGAATDPRGDGNILSAQQPPSSLHEPPQRDRLFALPPRR